MNAHNGRIDEDEVQFHSKYQQRKPSSSMIKNLILNIDFKYSSKI